MDQTNHGAVRRIANIETRLTIVVESFEAALDTDEGFLQAIGLLGEMRIAKSMAELQLKRVRRELTTYGAMREV